MAEPWNLSLRMWTLLPGSNAETLLALRNPKYLGFGAVEITVAWDDGALNVAAEHEDPDRDLRKTHHHRFRVPKTVDVEEITAEYTNGVLEVRLPVESGATTRGKPIEVHA